MKRTKESTKRRGLMLVLIAVLAVVAISGTLLARYIATSQAVAEMISADFHISSNYLEETAQSYTVTDWGEGISFQIYNYEKENLAQIAAEEITYTIDAPSGWTVTVEEAGQEVAPQNGKYTIGGGTMIAQTVTLVPGEDAATSGTVEVKTTAPYRKTLSATFTVDAMQTAQYSVTDKGNYVVLTVYSNDYADPVTVNWTEAFSPDNTNSLMASWLDTYKTGTFTTQANTTYELIFFKNTADTYSTDITSGTTITIGGNNG